MPGPGIKVKFQVVEDAAFRKLQSFPDEFLLHMTDAMREIEKRAEISAKRLAPVDSGTLRDSISQVRPRFNGNIVEGGLDASAPHALEVHETMAPAGAGLRPSQANQTSPGGPEGPKGGWFFKRVFEFENNIRIYNKVIDKFKDKAIRDHF